MNLSFTGEGGHTELTFEKEGVIVEWLKTTAAERDLIAKLFVDAREKGLETYTLDDDDKPLKISEAVPGWIFNRKGRLMIKGADGSTIDLPTLKILAKGIIDSEIKCGKLVMEEKDGEWKVLRIGDFVLKVEDEDTTTDAEASATTEPRAKSGKKQKVVSQKVPVGG